MSYLTNVFFSLSGIPKSKTYVETGMYRGDNLRRVLGKFENVYSIELDSGWYEFNQKYFSIYSNYHLIQGDSGEKLKEIEFDQEKSYTIFLDAHYSGPGTALGKLETPLLEELEALKEKLNPNSVIIIDDIRQLGKAGRQPGDGLGYKPFESDWSDITLDQIKVLLPVGFFCIENKNRWISSGAPDQLICFKSNKWRYWVVRAYDSLAIFHKLGVTSREGFIRKLKQMF